MTSIAAPICYGCVHMKASKPGDALTCDAFPEGIPNDILVSRTDHRDPVKGDHGIQFDPKDKAAATYAERMFDRGE